ncbi:VanZ like family protein [Arthrobacter sp. NIO-1057]|nr:VanZ like family protein [Arthrobacter sp. NIO-1057]
MQRAPRNLGRYQSLRNSLRTLFRHRSRGFWLLPLVYVLAMASIAFWPVPVDSAAGSQLASALSWLHAHGIPAFVNYEFVEFAANVIFFMPLGLILSFALHRFWFACALGLATSALIELGQLFFLPNRYATPTDVVANTLGACLGAGLWLVVRKISQR